MRNYAAFFVLNLLCFFSCAALAFAAPPLVRYQGQAVDAQGVPLESTRNIRFRLYPAETGGAAVWDELQSDVPFEAGLFNVLLGSQVSLADVDWTQPLWLGVQINQDPELAPRQQIASVPLAIRANVAESLATPITTSTINDDAHALVPSGAIILWTSASCPVGYTRLSALDGKFLVGGASYVSVAGGSNTHSHGGGTYEAPSHTHTLTDVPSSIGWNASNGTSTPGNPSDAAKMGQVNEMTANPGGTGAITGASALADNRPAFATVLLCQKD